MSDVALSMRGPVHGTKDARKVAIGSSVGAVIETTSSSGSAPRPRCTSGTRSSRAPARSPAPWPHSPPAVGLHDRGQHQLVTAGESVRRARQLRGRASLKHGGMTFTGKVIREHRVSAGANRESGCSAMHNRGIGDNVSMAAPRQRCVSRNPDRSNTIRDNRVSGWRTA